MEEAERLKVKAFYWDIDLDAGDGWNRWIEERDCVDDMNENSGKINDYVSQRLYMGNNK